MDTTVAQYQANATMGAAAIQGAVQMGNMVLQADLNHKNRQLYRWSVEKQIEEAQKQRDWNLDVWNKANEYNTPAAQIERLREAGLSPLSYLGNNQMVSPADGGSQAQLPTAPQMQNPMQYAGGLAQAVTAGYNAFLQNHIAQKQLENDTVRTLSEAQYKFALTKTEDAMRDGKVEFQGVSIDLGKSQKSLNDKQLEQVSAQIVELNEKVNLLRQYARESGARIDLMSWQKFCQEQKLPLEKRLLGQQIILANQQALDLKLTRRSRNMFMDAQREDLEQKRPYSNALMFQQARKDKLTADMTQEYYNKYWHRHQDLDLDIKENQAAQTRGLTKTPFSYAVDRGSDTVGKLLAPFVQAFQGYMFMQIGKSKGINMFPLSSPNPSSSSPYPSKTQLSPSDGYSMKAGGWMPQDYFTR